ncbi:Transcriptional regulator DauR [bioreactor metagenome]|uniref:Transcriptional regulator DauR n=1 Tax=bioreactor metagenome TaxID=1076179 RepID=A0A644VW53_9ZZZZ
MHPILKQYATIVEFLGKALGSQYEITLLDLSSAEHSIVSIINGHVSGRMVGSPPTDLALSFIKDKTFEKMDYKVGYRGVSSKNSTILSSTMFIKDTDGSLIGMLCLNYNAGGSVSILHDLAALLQVDDLFTSEDTTQNLQAIPPCAGIETFSNTIADLVNSTLSKVLPDPSVPVDRLTQDEKLQIVDALNQKGVFLVKSAVNEVSTQLHCSEASIYRYLSKLNKS